MTSRLFDTHTHFDVQDFDADRQALAMQAYQQGVHALVLIGFLQSRFADLRRTYQDMLDWQRQHPQGAVPTPFLAPGLHPLYIEQHQTQHLADLEQFLKSNDCVAIGEIGLDYFLPELKTTYSKQRQAEFFSAQLDLAKQYQKPVLLHIRRAHGDVLRILKQHKFTQGGIAHAFGGGAEEAKAFVKMGFKIGITGLITNPNAKKLQQVINHTTPQDWVIETDCPDMTPLCCQNSHERRTRNTPANLPYVLQALAEITKIAEQDLAQQLWQNSLACLNVKM
ncbi:MULTISPECIES: TatD family hydrolase [unclassified Acinetobacter]|uniref:TatD family hydrolase n=1 Tax=unclassified Acinetobacter TaxID=196816 RepID=UPI0035BAFF0C